MLPTSSYLKELHFGHLFRRSKSQNAIDEVDDSADCEVNKAGTLDGSPVIAKRKRSVFNGKWLSTPLRKLSPGKWYESNGGGLLQAVPDFKIATFNWKLPSALQTAITSTSSDTDKRPSAPPEEEEKRPPRCIGGDATTPGDGDYDGTYHNGGSHKPEQINDLRSLKPFCKQSLSASANAVGDEAQNLREQHSQGDNMERLKYLSLECREDGNKSRSLESPSSSPAATVSHVNNSHSDLVKTGNASVLTGDNSSVANNVSDDVSFKKRMLVIEELVKTEQDYVRDLKDIIDGYMAIMRDPDSCIPMPEGLKGGRDKIIFGNIEAIYEWHRDIFSKALEKCLEHPEDLGPLFQKYNRKLRMYVVYCQNKPLSEFIVTEYMDNYFEEIRQLLGHKLTLCDLLIKPVQRIMKYQLLLKDILKYTTRLGNQDEIRWMNQACTVMHVVPKEANDMMNVGRLQGFDGKISQLGKLLLFGPLICSEGTTALNFKGKELQAFFFEQSIILSEVVGKKTQSSNPVYIYKTRILLNRLALVEKVDDGDPLKFIIKSMDAKKAAVSYVCQAPNKANRDEWVENLRKICQAIKDIVNNLQQPLKHQNKLAKDL